MPTQISYKQANLSHAVGAVAISDMTAGKEKKRDGFIVLLNNDGTSQTITTSAIESPNILWNTDGLYFVDAKFDYFLAQKSNMRIAIKHHKKLPAAQVGIFENNQHEVISVLDHGFTRTRKNQLEFNSITLGKPRNTDIMQSRIYDVSSACESGTYTISPSDNGANSFNGTNGFVIKKNSKIQYP